MMTIEPTDGEGKDQNDSGHSGEPTLEMELALGRVLFPVFGAYLQKMGLLETSDSQQPAKQWMRNGMTLEETINRIAGAQLGHEFRLSRIEDSFQQVGASIQQLIQLAGEPNGRLDALEDTQVQADARLATLIESQIQLTQRLDVINARFDKVAEAIEALIAVQASADDQIRALMDRKDSTSKPNTGNAVRKAPRQATKKGAKNVTKQVTCEDGDAK